MSSKTRAARSPKPRARGPGSRVGSGRKRRELSGAIRLAVEAAVEYGLETKSKPTSPTIVGAQVFDAITGALRRARCDDAFAGRSKDAFARRFASVFGKTFDRHGKDYYLFREPDPGDVVDMFSTWANISWTAVDDARSAARKTELADAKRKQVAFEAERDRVAALPFEARLAEGGWSTWLSDPGLRATLLAPGARETYAPFVAASLGPSPRENVSGLALLALLGDADASEELAKHLGDPRRTGVARGVLEECAKLRLPTPVPAARVARAVAELEPSSQEAWLLAALCARRVATGELEAVLPEAVRLVKASADAIYRLHDIRSLTLDHRLTLDVALAWLDVAIKHGGEALAAEAHRAARSVLDQFLVVRNRPWPDTNHAAIAIRVLAKGKLSEDDMGVLRRFSWAHPDLLQAWFPSSVLAKLGIVLPARSEP